MAIVYRPHGHHLVFGHPLESQPIHIIQEVSGRTLTKVKLQQPARGADPRDPKTVSVYAVDAREVDPPLNEDAIHWRLLTTHVITTFSDAIRVIDLYRLRWLIEQLFRTLKSQALDIESSLLADGSALEALVATALIAATIIMQLVQARGEAGWTRPAVQVFTTF